jgi:hypothetical protein
MTRGYEHGAHCLHQRARSERWRCDTSHSESVRGGSNENYEYRACCSRRQIRPLRLARRKAEVFLQKSRGHEENNYNTTGDQYAC